jgi:hypothetical protein
MGKLFIFAGLFLILIGIVTVIAPHVPFLGKLPGDFHLKGKNYSLFFPLTTCLLLSILLTILLNLFLKR